MATKYVVTDMGPLDRREPGTDVTGVYPVDVLKRLMGEGYIEEVKPAKRRGKAADAAEVDEVSDGG